MENNPKQTVDVKSPEKKRPGITPRCAWCGDEKAKLKTVSVKFRKKEIPLQVCSDRCRSRVDGFLKSETANAFHFTLILVALVMIAAVIVVKTISFDGGAWGVLVLFVGNGVLINVYPFITRNAIELFGLDKTIKTARMMGKVEIALGVLFFLILKFLIPGN